MPDLTVVDAITVLVLDARVTAADGRTLVVHGHHIGSQRASLVANDVASGRELARR